MTRRKREHREVLREKIKEAVREELGIRLPEQGPGKLWMIGRILNNVTRMKSEVSRLSQSSKAVKQTVSQLESSVRRGSQAATSLRQAVAHADAFEEAMSSASHQLMQMEEWLKEAQTQAEIDVKGGTV